jgi:DNA-binding NarL/FixJ family response regulator
MTAAEALVGDQEISLEELTPNNPPEVPFFDASSLASVAPGQADADDQTLSRAGRYRLHRSSRRSNKRARSVPTVIVDKSALFRAGLAHCLAGGRFRIAAGVSTLCELPDHALQIGQCLVLVGLNGEDNSATLSQIASLKARRECLHTIILTEQFRPEDLLAAIEAGAEGYLIKNEITPEALVQSLELVLLGGVVIPQLFSRTRKGWMPLLDDVPVVAETAPESAGPQLANDAVRSADRATLSNREQTILQQLTRGASNKQIGRELNIAEATVKVHVKSLLRKIRVNNRTQAAIWAIEKLRPVILLTSLIGVISS